MTHWVWWLMVTAAVILAAAGTYLAWLNWNETLSATTISVLLGGAVAFFIAVLSGLRSSEITERFVSAVILDEAALPVWFDATTPAPPEERIGLLSSLRSINGATPFPEAKDSASRQNRAAELLQYHLFKQFMTLGPEAGVSVQVAHTIDVSLRPAFDCPLQKVDRASVVGIDLSPFAASSNEKQILEHVGLFIPEGARAHFLRNEAPEIVVERPGYFRLSIKVKSLGENHGVLPKGFESLQVRAKQCYSIPLLVEIKARFEKLAGGSRYSAQVKEWVRAVGAHFRASAATQSS